MINEKMAADLRALGIKSDDTVFVHSSLKSLGYVEGGADTVIDTLLSVLSDGTLLMPAFSYRYSRPETPYFSVNETPCCVGTIPETFRKRPGTIRSVHPSHSAAGIGKYAEEILGEHIKSTTPVGPESPLALLPKYHGKVLMLGCGTAPNTSMHGIEELVVPPYLYRDGDFAFTIVDKDGNETVKRYKFHNFANTAQRYGRLEGLMEYTKGKVLEADCYVIDTETMWKVGYEKMKEDPMYFVDTVQPK